MAELKNVRYEVEGDTLTIVVDLSQDLGLSASGKSELVASTGGGTQINGAERGVMLNLTVYRKR